MEFRVEPVTLTDRMQGLGHLLGVKLLPAVIWIPIGCVVGPTRTPYDAPASELTGVRGRSVVELFLGRKPFLLSFFWVSFSFFFLAIVNKLWQPLMAERHALPVLVPVACLGLSFLFNVSRGAFGLLLALVLAPRVNKSLLEHVEEIAVAAKGVLAPWRSGIQIR